MSQVKTKEVLSSPFMYKYWAMFGGILLLSLLATFGFFGEDIWLFFVLAAIFLAVQLVIVTSDRKVALNQSSLSGAEIKQLSENASVKKLELEKQLSLNQFPLSDHFIPFIEKLEKTGMEQIRGITHTQFLELYKTLEEAFERNNAVPLSRLASIPDDVKRVNQIETLIDLYAEKKQRVRSDKNLNDEDRDSKLENWERLMDRDISRLDES